MKPPTGTPRGFWKFFCPLPSMTKHHARCVGGYENKQEPRPCPQKLFQLPRWTCVQLTSSGQHFPNQQPGSKAWVTNRRKERIFENGVPGNPRCEMPNSEREKTGEEGKGGIHSAKNNWAPMLSVGGRADRVSKRLTQTTRKQVDFSEKGLNLGGKGFPQAGKHPEQQQQVHKSKAQNSKHSFEMTIYRGYKALGLGWG